MIARNGTKSIIPDTPHIMPPRKIAIRVTKVFRLSLVPTAYGNIILASRYCTKANIAITPTGYQIDP
jgi:hypothetical protein